MPLALRTDLRLAAGRSPTFDELWNDVNALGVTIMPMAPDPDRSSKRKSSGFKYDPITNQIHIRRPLFDGSSKPQPSDFAELAHELEHVRQNAPIIQAYPTAQQRLLFEDQRAATMAWGAYRAYRLEKELRGFYKEFLVALELNPPALVRDRDPKREVMNLRDMAMRLATTELQIYLPAYVEDDWKPQYEAGRRRHAARERGRKR